MPINWWHLKQSKMQANTKVSAKRSHTWGGHGRKQTGEMFTSCLFTVDFLRMWACLLSLSLISVITVIGFWLATACAAPLQLQRWRRKLCYWRKQSYESLKVVIVASSPFPCVVGRTYSLAHQYDHNILINTQAENVVSFQLKVKYRKEGGGTCTAWN